MALVGAGGSVRGGLWVSSACAGLLEFDEGAAFDVVLYGHFGEAFGWVALCGGAAVEEGVGGDGGCGAFGVEACYGGDFAELATWGALAITDRLMEGGRCRCGLVS